MFRKIFVLFLLSTNLVFARENNADLVRIEDYLNSITTIQSDFIQTDPTGTISEGRFYMKKPGKFRWDYFDQPILIVANGKSLIYYDKELEQSNYVPIEKSIASLLVRKKIVFGGDLEITDFRKEPEYIKLSLVKRNQRDVGEFTFFFGVNPLRLGHIELIDTSEQRLIVNFMNFKTNVHVDSDLFEIKDKRLR